LPKALPGWCRELAAVLKYMRVMLHTETLWTEWTMDESFEQEIKRAQQMTGDEKVRESLQLFERTSQLMLDGLRDESPLLTEDELLIKLYERLAINRELENASC
jgi:hypothetical protein